MGSGRGAREPSLGLGLGFVWEVMSMIQGARGWLGTSVSSCWSGMAFPWQNSMSGRSRASLALWGSEPWSGFHQSQDRKLNSGWGRKGLPSCGRAKRPKVRELFSGKSRHQAGPRSVRSHSCP